MHAFPTGPWGRSPSAAARVAVAALSWRRTDGGTSPIVPFGHLRGVLLCQHHLRDGRSPLLLRELSPLLDPRRGRCFWTSGPVVCDLTRPWLDSGDQLSIKSWQPTLLSSAGTLIQALQAPATSTEPTLPYTVASIPRSAQVVPRPTDAILALARQQNMPWPLAWKQLALHRALPGTDDLHQIDTRLCDRLKPGLTWPGAVAVAHDLRDVPMLHIWRPPLAASVPESLFVYQPHAILDGWNAPEPLMQRLGMEHFPPPAMAATHSQQPFDSTLALAS